MGVLSSFIPHVATVSTLGVGGVKLHIRNHLDNKVQALYHTALSSLVSIQHQVCGIGLHVQPHLDEPHPLAC
jgi:hypothetical protein